MLNFTTSGGIYRPELQKGFFGSLHAFWNGAGFVEGACSLLYFDGGAAFAGRVASRSGTGYDDRIAALAFEFSRTRFICNRELHINA